jgi:hypothetical protein
MFIFPKSDGMLIRRRRVPNHQHKPLENVGGMNFLTTGWRK